MIFTTSDEEAGSTSASAFLPWTLLTHPYCITAIICGVLALAVSHYLQQETKPPRDAKRRVVQSDIRRLSESAFLFMGGYSAPFTLVDITTAIIYSLYPSPQTDRPSEAGNAVEPCDEDSLQHYTVDGSVYTAKRLAAIADVRVLERGLYFQEGRAVRLAFADQEATLAFQTRVATEAFLDVLHCVLEQKRPEKLSVFLTTFNVGSAQPPDDLTPWLGNAAKADIVAIGAQECSYTTSLAPSGPPLADQLSTNTAEDTALSRDDSKDITDSSLLLETEMSHGESLTSSSSTSYPVTTQSSGHASAREHWQALLVSHFPEEEYACITKQAAWNRYLTIFVRLNLLPAVSHVRSDTANVGLGRVAGNKGAIGTRFTVFDTDFVIINSHLAAHHKEVNRRNEDFCSIAHGLHGLRDNSGVDILASPIHHFFWMGDLNYRINLERNEVLRLVHEENWRELQAADQLLKQKKLNLAFEGFLEGETNFPPTYRYEQGSRNYSEAKLRIPSWCDRILYRSLPGCKLQLHSYKPADEILTSDHSPVWALFTASLVHTTGIRDLNSIVSSERPAAIELPSPLLLSSPRSLSVRSLLPTSFGSRTLQLVFKNLSATDIPEMDHGGRRIAVAKVLRIDNHLAWKKHEDLGEGQHADPYCTFHGSAIAELDEGEFRTSTVTASQNPVWKSEDIPSIDLIDNDISVLRNRYVIVTVKDENPARRDGTIGSAVIWLGGAGENGSIKFSAAIMSGGRRRGKLAGEYMVRPLHSPRAPILT